MSVEMKTEIVKNLVDQQILWLQISMKNIMTVTELETSQKLVHERLEINKNNEHFNNLETEKEEQNGEANLTPMKDTPDGIYCTPHNHTLHAVSV